ncbi:MAG: pyruvate kinase [Cyanobacteria bacterium]|nr:pyruvate kinase [Cyanobacteria bacterium CG_2015-16_32_12]NCO77651.1 pyruvate kinase [Cyanobacteria bacterium CG_2015-22_32_23]NCQ04117.1 pyruvate kinase [Cyanobacteria bacterium CG_2015-09_32_10]NCQ41496.1 pyruvate kinase [Cyanobacteria bacterium CG_2015-04_32_10]NCS85932.1 pyruvate kinase [Cyanobacteria bacterium CG_2015-02_32_10]
MSDKFSHRTKIVATVGPDCANPETLRQMILAGANTFRLNFSHGTHEVHQRSIRLIRQVENELNIPIGILQDLQGPKIRLGKFNCGSIEIKEGDRYILTSREVECNQEIGCISYENLAEEVPVNARILIDDGRVEMVVKAIDLEKKDLHCQVVVGGVLSSNKGVNFPNVYLSVKALTDKDKIDLMFGLDQKVDWVALSFVRNPQDVLEIKDLISSAGKSTPVIAKIEKHEAIEQMEEILSLCDGVMVARGDLGVELPAEDVPILQKRLIRTANRLGIPIITATQMLDSMANSPSPTRAEVSDVANAILDGTDAVMLSNETAVGKYPVLAVATMAKIAARIEQERDNIVAPYNDNFDNENISTAIAAAVSQIAKKLHASAIMTLTKTGATARNVSKFRPQTPIFAITPHVSVSRQLQLVWGVKPLLLLDLPGLRQVFQAAINVAREKNLLHDGNLVVMTAGTLQGVAGSTDLIKVEIVKGLLSEGIGIGQGEITGRTKVIQDVSQLNNFNTGDILVTKATDNQYVDAMRIAGAIVTEETGVRSHAAQIGMRLGIPVIVGVKEATRLIRDASFITLKIEQGLVYLGTDGSKGGDVDN